MRSLSIYPTEDVIQDMFNGADSDGNGLVDFIEFLGMMTRKVEISTEDLQEDFKTFGKRCFGYISDEFLEVLARGEKLTDNELETMIHKADRPISSDELVKMMTDKKVVLIKEQ